MKTVPAWCDLIYVTLRRNDEFLHSLCNFSKSNAFDENFVRVKFILYKFFFLMSILSSRKTSRMFFNLYWKNCKKPFMWENDHFERNTCLSTKINITFFVGIEVLNIFHITIKKKEIPEYQQKIMFKGHDHFSGNEVSDDKNEYNLLYGKWATKYGFEIFSSKTPIPAEWKPRNQFWGHISPHVTGSVGPIVSKKKKKQGSPMCGLAPTTWISYKSNQNCNLYRDSNNYYKLKI